MCLIENSLIYFASFPLVQFYVNEIYELLFWAAYILKECQAYEKEQKEFFLTKKKKKINHGRI